MRLLEEVSCYFGQVLCTTTLWEGFLHGCCQLFRGRCLSAQGLNLLEVFKVLLHSFGRHEASSVMGNEILGTTLEHHLISLDSSIERSCILRLTDTEVIGRRIGVQQSYLSVDNDSCRLEETVRTFVEAEVDTVPSLGRAKLYLLSGIILVGNVHQVVTIAGLVVVEHIAHTLHRLNQRLRDISLL